MRTLVILCVLIAASIAYVAQSSRVNAQTATDTWWSAFDSGQTVRLDVDLPGGTIRCKVTRVANGFIGCAAEDRFRGRDRWINLRFVKEITPIPQP
jgi:hypothetical protein